MLEIDDEKAQRPRPERCLTSTARSSISFGRSYVNDFIDRGRVKKRLCARSGRMLADEPGRLRQKWYVRNNAGTTWCRFPPSPSGEWIYGSPKLAALQRCAEAMEVLGSSRRAGYSSSGEAMAASRSDHAKKLPKPVSAISWTGLSYEERLSGSQAPALYALSLLMVFLCLAALYESWSIPIAVMLVVPLGDHRCAGWPRSLRGLVQRRVSSRWAC
jgi:multidrug efflux pump